MALCIFSVAPTGWLVSIHMGFGGQSKSNYSNGNYSEHRLKVRQKREQLFI